MAGSCASLKDGVGNFDNFFLMSIISSFAAFIVGIWGNSFSSGSSVKISSVDRTVLNLSLSAEFVCRQTNLMLFLCLAQIGYVRILK